MIDKAALYRQVEELYSILGNQDTVYDYEKTFDEKRTQISEEIFGQILGL